METVYANKRQAQWVKYNIITNLITSSRKLKTYQKLKTWRSYGFYFLPSKENIGKGYETIWRIQLRADL